MFVTAIMLIIVIFLMMINLFIGDVYKDKKIDENKKKRWKKFRNKKI